MRNVKIGTLISKSIDRTGEILFRPFNLRKWLTLLLIAMLAGSLSSGSNSGGGGGNRVNQAEEQQIEEGDPELAGTAQEETAEPETQAAAEEKSSPSLARTIFIASIVVILVLGLAVFFSWVNARFRFVWLHAVQHNVTPIKEPFHRYRKQGQSLFRFMLIVSVVSIVFVLLLIGWILFALASQGAFSGAENIPWGRVLVIALLPAGTALLILIPFGLLLMLVDDFVVPIMAEKDLTVKEGLRALRDLYSANKKDVWIYIGMRIVLGFVTGMAIVLAALAAVVVILIAAGIIFGAAYVIFMSLLKSQILFAAVAVLLGIPFSLAAIILVMSSALPVAVFYRNFSLFYLTSLNSGYQPLRLEA